MKQLHFFENSDKLHPIHNGKSYFLKMAFFVFVLSISAFTLDGWAILPPLRNVQVTSQTSGGNINYKFSVFDEQRNQTKEGETGFWLSSRITTPVASDGVVTWRVQVNTFPNGSPQYRVYFSVYDPKIGSWNTSFQDAPDTTISSSVQSSNGVVLWNLTVGNSTTSYTRFYFRAYNPNSSSWSGADFNNQNNSTDTFPASGIGGGIGYWAKFSKPSGSSTGNLTVYTLAFDVSRGGWINGQSSNVSVNGGTVNSFNISNGTLSYNAGGATFFRGYNSDGGNWYGGTTIPLAYFVPSQTTGSIPLKVYFWDVSLGGSGWSWNFGNGGTSGLQSPFYTYNSAAGSPFTVTQTVSGPGGTRSRSATISPTSYSISGNVANKNGFKINGATVTLSGTVSGTTQTDTNGNYSFNNLTSNGNYTVTVAKTRYVFSPQSLSFNNLNGNQTGNFIGKLNDKPSDFDGDGKTDVSIFRPSTGVWSILNSSNSSATDTSFGQGTDKVAPGDYDSDGKTDIGVWRPSDGTWYIIQSSDSTFNAYQFGSNGDIPVANDYDGDDKTDRAVFRPSDGNWYILKSSNSQVQSVAFGVSTDKPVIGDYNGDERADFAVFRPSDSTWYVMRSSDFGTFGQQFGNSSDKPVQGDYDGDGITDYATFRPSDSNWRVLNSSNSTTTVQYWGSSSDKPAPGDYDGDGKYDFGLYRSSDGTWYILLSNNQTYYSVFGVSEDFPTPSSYIPE